MVILVPKNEKGIFVTIRFWTDFTQPNGKLGITPKQAWAAGSIYVRASDLHGIKAGDPIIFNNLEELMVKLDQLLKQHDVSLVIKDDEGNLRPRLGKSYPKWTWTG
jgi:hypothetical protein